MAKEIAELTALCIALAALGTSCAGCLTDKVRVQRIGQFMGGVAVAVCILILIFF